MRVSDPNPAKRYLSFLQLQQAAGWVVKSVFGALLLSHGM
jgi:hypothetical protein